MQCDVPGCSYSTQKSYNMLAHIRSHNEELLVCSQKFLSSSHLLDHIKAVHTKERTFQCPSCPRAFATSWQAKSHIKNNHGQKKSYKCQKCTRSGFKTPQALAGHVKSFHMTKVKVLSPYLSELEKFCHDLKKPFKRLLSIFFSKFYLNPFFFFPKRSKSPAMPVGALHLKYVSNVDKF